jgi:hypothetical protein
MEIGFINLRWQQQKYVGTHIVMKSQVETCGPVLESVLISYRDKIHLELNMRAHVR